MAEPRFVTDDVAFGEPPSEDALDDLAARGFRTIVNVVEDEGRTLTARDEGVQARERDLEYVFLLVDGGGLHAEDVGNLQAKLRLLPKPAYVHARSGDRAASMAVLAVAGNDGWNADRAASRLGELGVEPPEGFRAVAEEIAES